MRRESCPNNGFTLIELLIVIVVVGAMMAIAVPRFGDSLKRQSVQSARNLVVSRHAITRATAVQRARQTRLVFSGGGLVIRTQHPVTGATDTVGSPENLYTDYGVTLSATRDSLVFDSRGLGAESGPTEVVISKGGYADTVRISSMGRVLK